MKALLDRAQSIILSFCACISLVFFIELWLECTLSGIFGGHTGVRSFLADGNGDPQKFAADVEFHRDGIINRAFISCSGNLPE